MSKTALVNDIADSAKCTKAEATRMLEQVTESIHRVTQADGKAAVPGFGVFSMKTSNRTVGRNPRTGEEVRIIPRPKLTFKVSSTLN